MNVSISQIRLTVGASLLLAACGLNSACRGAELAERLQPLIDGHAGKVAVAVKHLKTGESFAYQADVPMPTASLIKFPVMIEAYRQAKEGKVDLNKMLTLREEDKVPGSGILTQHFSAGANISLRDAIRLMIVYSDNTATNLVLGEIGLQAVADEMQRLECRNTRINALVFRRETSIAPQRSKQFGLGSTTASEMLRLFELLHKKELVDADSSARMLDHLKHCEDRTKLASRLPSRVAIAHKSGSVSQVRCDAGIIYSSSGPIAICVLTAENDDRRWSNDNAGNRVCGAIAEAALRHFETRGPIEAPPIQSGGDEAQTTDLQPPDGLDGPPFVTCKAWAIANARTGDLLWSHRGDKKLDIASTTKIMTAFLVLRLAEENRDVLDEEIVFSARADGTSGSTSGVRDGERLPVRELMYGLLLPSGNDASVALAEHFGSRLAPASEDGKDDSLERFVAAMNQTAKRLGMNDTHYENPHGLTAKGHVSTAQDLLRLTRRALQLASFRDYVATRNTARRSWAPVARSATWFGKTRTASSASRAFMASRPAPPRRPERAWFPPVNGETTAC